MTEVAEVPGGKGQPEPSTCPCPSCGPHWAPGMGGAATDCPQLPQELELQEQLAGWPRGEGGESQSSCQSRVTAVGHERVTAGAQGPAAARDPLRSGQGPSVGSVSGCTTQVTMQDGRGTAAKAALCQLVLAPAGGYLAGKLSSHGDRGHMLSWWACVHLLTCATVHLTPGQLDRRAPEPAAWSAFRPHLLGLRAHEDGSPSNTQRPGPGRTLTTVPMARAWASHSRVCVLGSLGR